VTRVRRVFHRKHAGRPLRIIWTLEEVGEPYELTILSPEESTGEEHRERHPLGRVPVLHSEEGHLFESAAMCMHVGDLHPEAGLMPELGSHERALVYQWACFAPAEIEPPLFEVWSQAERDPERSAKARKRFDAATEAVAGALDGGEYLVGGRFSVADVMVGTALLFTTRAGFAEELPEDLKAYLAGLGRRPAFQRALARTFG
jgi:glutathione S-transferase